MVTTCSEFYLLTCISGEPALTKGTLRGAAVYTKAYQLSHHHHSQGNTVNAVTNTYPSYRANLQSLSPAQRYNLIIGRLFLATCLASLMASGLVFLAIDNGFGPVLMYLLPILALPYIVWRGACRGSYFRGTQFRGGYVKKDSPALKKEYRNAVIGGVLVAVLVGIGCAAVDSGGAASFFTVIVGAFAAGWFHIRGFLAGWNRVDAMDSNNDTTFVAKPNAATGLLIWSVLLTVLTLLNLSGIMQLPSMLEQAAAGQSQSQTCDSLCQAMSGNSSDSQ